MAVDQISSPKTSPAPVSKAPRQSIQDEIIAAGKKSKDTRQAVPKPVASSTDDAVTVKLSSAAASPKHLSIQQQLLNDGAGGPQSSAPEKTPETSSAPSKPHQSVQQEIIDSQKKAK